MNSQIPTFASGDLVHWWVKRKSNGRGLSGYALKGVIISVHQSYSALVRVDTWPLPHPRVLPVQSIALLRLHRSPDEPGFRL